MVIFQKYFISLLIIVDYTILPNFSPIGALFGILIAKNPEMTSNLPLTFFWKGSMLRKHAWACDRLQALPELLENAIVYRYRLSVSVSPIRATWLVRSEKCSPYVMFNQSPHSPDGRNVAFFFFFFFKRVIGWRQIFGPRFLVHDFQNCITFLILMLETSCTT